MTGALHDAPFLRACRREDTTHTPVWLMRQAGRYMSEYRAVRARVSMLELCKTPALVSEVTVHAATTLGVDAAIIFADLLLLVEAFGLTLTYEEGEGPVIAPPVRDARAVDALPEVDADALAYVYDAIAHTRAALPPAMPLLGFAGAPFTMAAYLIEGGSSRQFQRTKSFMYGDEGAWNALCAKIVRATAPYLARQLTAGAQAVQIFDSWVGCLSPADYRRYVLPHTRALCAALPQDAPVIHFATGNPALLADMRAAGGSVMGVDWRCDLDDAWRTIGHDTAIMGNLDPLALFAPRDVLERAARDVLNRAQGRRGHIFNLGHGIVPQTPVDNVRRLVRFVQETTSG